MYDYFIDNNLLKTMQRTEDEGLMYWVIGSIKEILQEIKFGVGHHN